MMQQKIVSNLLNLSGNYIFNIAGDEIVSIKKITNIIGKITGNIPIYKYQNKSDFNLIADNEIMKKYLCSPETRFVDGLNETCHSYLD